MYETVGSCLHYMRGVVTRAINEGGKQERHLAEAYRKWAAGMPTFSRTSSLLKNIAEQWDMDATYEDVSAEKQKLRD